ncbi:hypothetical protein HanXRQr2_Chr05g0201931 [Helianthus annuus]|uniref:Uncharacterized protein n=1 Tax=Helianthus annuus TaxID=4232 RepID=A0A9K3NM64_HELAN|nr:hypothetical protein HanXRQr2_Chr05g0201931 [Helianthus annuus]KAJ0921709.1 hypothetical protein HanPSC8_Chr05g0194761 [Helianthus annuus]
MCTTLMVSDATSAFDLLEEKQVPIFCLIFMTAPVYALVTALSRTYTMSSCVIRLGTTF